MIGIVIAMASLTVAVVGALLTLALKLSAAQARADSLNGRSSAQEQVINERGAKIDQLTAALKTANARVEALDGENQKLRAAQPVAGSFDRLLQEARSGVAEGGLGTGVVPHDKPAAPSGANALLDPNAP